MKTKKINPNKPWWIRLNLLPAFLNLLCLAFFFLPLAVYVSASGQGFILSSVKLLFGGQEAFLVDGFITSFYYEMNIWLLADMQVFLLSALAGFLCKGSTKLTIIGILLELLGLGLTGFSLSLISANCPGLTLDNLRFGIGAFLILIAGAFALIFLISYLVLILRFKPQLSLFLSKSKEKKNN